MTLFTGQSEHKLDAKGRLFVPRRIVDEVEDPADRGHFWMTIGDSPCLYLYTGSAFNAHREDVKRKARGNESFANVMRGMARLTSKQSLDSQGRMLIPADLREHAGLDKEIVVVGVFDWVEIWDARRWNESASADAEAAYLEQAAEFFNGGSPDSLEERP